MIPRAFAASRSASPVKTNPHVSLDPAVARSVSPVGTALVSYAFVQRHFAERARPAIIAGWDVTTLNSLPVAAYAAAITSVSRLPIPTP